MRNRKPSATAHVIAASTVFLSYDPRYAPLIPDLAVEASIWFMQACSRVSPRLIGLMEQHWFRAVVAALERAMVPGIMLHYLLRKRWIEDCVRACLAEGVDQIVIMGAGFDALALRLHREFPHVRFFEIDHPDTQQVKRRASESRSMLAANIRFIAADLTQESWERALLSQSDFRDQADTLVIAEAVLMYLQPTIWMPSSNSCASTRISIPGSCSRSWSPRTTAKSPSAMRRGSSISGYGGEENRSHGV